MIFEGMHPSALHDEISDIISSSLHVSAPAVDTDLLENGTIDSLALIELLMQLEKRYGVRITAETLDFDSFRSISKIARFVVLNS